MSGVTSPSLDLHSAQPSAQDGGPAAVMTPVVLVSDSSTHGAGKITANTKMAMVLATVLFFLLVLGFCVVARKHESHGPVLPVRSLLPFSEQRKSVQRWLKDVQAAPPHDELVTVAHPLPSLYHHSASSLSGSTIVSIPYRNPYLQSPLQSPSPVHLGARSTDAPHAFGPS